ncbi:MAG: putative Ig domain-containing protein, partial [Salaquimonas sp.]
TIDNSASQGGNTATPGEYLVTITATDPSNNTATTTVTYTITNIPPDAQDDEVTAPEDGLSTGSVFADNGNGVDQDTPPDTDPITVGQVDGDPANVGAPTPGTNGGTFTINLDGTYEFDPGTDFQDLDDGETRVTLITYTIDDGNGGTDTATVTVTVEGANDAPVIIDPNDPFPNPNDPPVPADPNNVIPDVDGFDSTSLAPLDVSPYFYDVDGDPLTLSLDPATTPAWLTIDSNGVISGTPPSDASQGGPASDGVYTITIIATDDNGAEVTTNVTFTIVNVPPTTSGLPDDMEVAGNQYEVPTAQAFNDPDGDVLTYSATGLPNGLTIDPVTGLISGQVDPAAVSQSPNGDGFYIVEVTADDGQGGTVTTSFELLITDPVNPEMPGPLGPLPPDGGPQAMPGTPQSELIIDGTVNTIGSLGGNVGLFDVDHPVTQALYQISPLSEALSLDANGHPVTEAISWIEKTRQALANGAGDGELANGLSYFLGADMRVADQSGDVIIRTMVWQDMVFVEAIGAGKDFEWELESLNGGSSPSWVDQYGANLLALKVPANLTDAELVLLGSDRFGNEIRLRISLHTLNGQLDNVRLLSNEQAQNFSGQLQALLNKPISEARSLLLNKI